jgi:hypothetical protein
MCGLILNQTMSKSGCPFESGAVPIPHDKKKSVLVRSLASSTRQGTGTIGSGSARRAKVLMSAPPNSQPLARHVRRRCGHEFARVRARG